MQGRLFSSRKGNRLDGCLQNDRAIFERAYEISQDNPRTSVWEMAQGLDDETFEKLRKQAFAWYNEKCIFPYALPLPSREIEWDNCLSELAMRWRGSSSDEEATAIAHHYQVILRWMIDLGFRQSLQVEAELPDDLMPQEYLDLFT